MDLLHVLVYVCKYVSNCFISASSSHCSSPSLTLASSFHRDLQRAFANQPTPAPTPAQPPSRPPPPQQPSAPAQLPPAHQPYQPPPQAQGVYVCVCVHVGVTSTFGHDNRHLPLHVAVHNRHTSCSIKFVSASCMSASDTSPPLPTHNAAWGQQPAAPPPAQYGTYYPPPAPQGYYQPPPGGYYPQPPQGYQAPQQQFNTYYPQAPQGTYYMPPGVQHPPQYRPR